MDERPDLVNSDLAVMEKRVLAQMTPAEREAMQKAQQDRMVRNARLREASGALSEETETGE